MMWHMYPWSLGDLMPVGMIIFWGLIGYVIYLAITAYRPRRRRTIINNSTYRAISIAKERLASGEITPEEFERIHKRLE